MDPAASILSALDFTLTQDDINANFVPTNMNLGFEDDFDFIDFDNLMYSDDSLSAILNDQFLNPFDFFEDVNSFASSLCNSKDTTSSNTTVNGPNQKSVSILKKNSNQSKLAGIKISAPKVYVSQSKKKTSNQGTSILVKEKKFKRSSNKNSLLNNVESKPKAIYVSAVDDSLKDHDYCHTLFDTGSQSHEKNQTEFTDILEGYCTDDVVLNELPECLSSLFGLREDINSEELLNGLNDVCNFMTDQYIEENLNKDLPNLNLTEEDLNQVIQNCNSKEREDNKNTTDIDSNIIYSEIANELSNVDSYDSASITTGCTDESFIEEKHCLRLKNKSKRNRSLSSSAIFPKRKRRFSTRSSINSSDSMSDSSSLESSSSRNSSPERTFSFPSLVSENYSVGYCDKFKMKNKKNRLKKSWNRTYTKKGKCQVIDLVYKRRYTLNSKLASSQHRLQRKQSDVAKSKRKTNKNVNENILHIGDLPIDVQESDIKNWFGKFGTIEDVQIFALEDQSCSALVTYQNVEETYKAIKHGNDDSNHPKFILSFDSCSKNLDFRIE